MYIYSSFSNCEVRSAYLNINVLFTKRIIYYTPVFESDRSDRIDIEE